MDASSFKQTTGGCVSLCFRVDPGPPVLPERVGQLHRQHHLSQPIGRPAVRYSNCFSSATLLCWTFEPTKSPFGNVKDDADRRPLYSLAIWVMGVVGGVGADFFPETLERLS